MQRGKKTKIAHSVVVGIALLILGLELRGDVAQSVSAERTDKHQYQNGRQRAAQRGRRREQVSAIGELCKNRYMKQKDNAQTVGYGCQDAPAKILHDIAGFPHDDHGTHENAVGIIGKVSDQVPDDEKLRKKETENQAVLLPARQQTQRCQRARDRQIEHQRSGKSVMDEGERTAQPQKQLEIYRRQKQGQYAGKWKALFDSGKTAIS